MAAYEYIAVDADGQRQTGLISADSPRDARRDLRLRELLPVEVRPAAQVPANTARSRARVREQDRVMAIRQLAALIGAAVPVESALTAVAEDSPPALKRALFAVKSEVSEGATLSDALRTAPHAFPPLVCAVTASGERAGRLGDVLERLAGQLERSFQMRQKVMAALIYPAFLTAMASAMIITLLVVIVPKLAVQFEAFGAPMPPFTQVVLSLSNGLVSYGWIALVAIVLAVFLAGRAMRVEAMAAAFDRYVLTIPLVGHLVRTVTAARFARVFATLAGAGAPVLDALAGAKAACGNRVFINAAAAVSEKVRQGGGFSAELKRTGVFPPILVHMVASGESGRDLPGMMDRAAQFLEQDFETRSAALLALLEPVIILCLGLVIGLIVMAVMLPILQLNTVALS